MNEVGRIESWEAETNTSGPAHTGDMGFPVYQPRKAEGNGTQRGDAVMHGQGRAACLGRR